MAESNLTSARRDRRPALRHRSRRDHLPGYAEGGAGGRESYADAARLRLAQASTTGNAVSERSGWRNGRRSLLIAAMRPARSPWRAAATSCRSIRLIIRMRSRSRRWRPERAADAPARRQDPCLCRRTPSFAGAIRRDRSPPIESLGSFVIVRVNPASPLAKDEASICALHAGP